MRGEVASIEMCRRPQGVCGCFLAAETKEGFLYPLLFPSYFLSFFISDIKQKAGKMEVMAERESRFPLQGFLINIGGGKKKQKNVLLFRIQGIKITLQLGQVFMENLLSAWLWDEGHVCRAGRGRQQVRAGCGQAGGIS